MFCKVCRLAEHHFLYGYGPSYSTEIRNLIPFITLFIKGLVLIKACNSFSMLGKWKEGTYFLRYPVDQATEYGCETAGKRKYTIKKTVFLEVKIKGSIKKTVFSSQNCQFSMKNSLFSTKGKMQLYNISEPKAPFNNWEAFIIFIITRDVHMPIWNHLLIKVVY